jgi:hypothetical protein
MEEC